MKSNLSKLWILIWDKAIDNLNTSNWLTSLSKDWEVILFSS